MFSRQQVRVSQVLVNDHRGLARVTVGVAHSRTLTSKWPRVPSISKFEALHR